jgi:hypothetical protein
LPGGTFVQVDENNDASNGFYDEMLTVDTNESIKIFKMFI